VCVSYESLEVGRNVDEYAVTGLSHARNQFTGMEVVVSLDRVSRVEWP